MKVFILIKRNIIKLMICKMRTRNNQVLVKSYRMKNMISVNIRNFQQSIIKIKDQLKLMNIKHTLIIRISTQILKVKYISRIWGQNQNLKNNISQINHFAIIIPILELNTIKNQKIFLHNVEDLFNTLMILRRNGLPVFLIN